VSNCVGTGIKPQSKAKDPEFSGELYIIRYACQYMDESEVISINELLHI